MLNKQDLLIPYILQLGEGSIKVISMKNGEEKARLSIELAHGLIMPKLQKTSNLKIKSPEGPSEELKEEESASQVSWWYPLKIMLTPVKSRTLFFDNRGERKGVLSAILTE